MKISTVRIGTYANAARARGPPPQSFFYCGLTSLIMASQMESNTTRKKLHSMEIALMIRLMEVFAGQTVLYLVPRRKSPRTEDQQ